MLYVKILNNSEKITLTVFAALKDDEVALERVEVHFATCTRLTLAVIAVLIKTNTTLNYSEFYHHNKEHIELVKNQKCGLTKDVCSIFEIAFY